MNAGVLEGAFAVGQVAEEQAEKERLRLEQRNLDALLVGRAKDGDLASFRMLVERYQAKAHAVALGIVGSYEDAEDVVQEAFLKAFRSLSSFREQSSFYTWLYRIVFNLSIDLSRKSYRSAEISVESSPAVEKAASEPRKGNYGYVSHIDGPDASFERAELQAGFKRALASLSPQHRAVIVLREIDGLSYEEISSVVGCSKGTVMSRLHHARKRLQAALKDYYEPASGLVTRGAVEKLSAEDR